MGCPGGGPADSCSWSLLGMSGMSFMGPGIAARGCRFSRAEVIIVEGHGVVVATTSFFKVGVGGNMIAAGPVAPCTLSMAR